jgi:Ca2+-binding RTX toxin-like protein
VRFTAKRAKNRVDIFGSVVGAVSAISFAWGGSTLNNADNIINIYEGARAWGYNGAAILLVGYRQTVLNQGEVWGQTTGIDFTAQPIVIGSATGSSLTSGGTIEGGNYGVYHRLADGGPTYAYDGLTVVNTGSIIGATASYSSESGRGLIDLLANSGSLIGDIVLGDGADNIDTTLGIVQGTIDLGAGNDTAYGSAAADNIQGGGENDVIRGNGGNDNLDGGVGTQDYIDFADKTSKVEIMLLAPGLTGTAKVNGVIEDSFVNFEAVIGGKAGDVLTGNAGSNNIAGGDGNDTQQGGSAMTRSSGATAMT